MNRCRDRAAVVAVVLLTCVIAIAGEDEGALASPAQQLRATEVAFAKTMADRDHNAFVSYLAQETIFFSGDHELRGKDAVAAAWKPYFEGPDAPFKWRPETVAVLDSGTLGLTSGPVLSPQGERVGTFNSIWRREPDGSWKIVFDRGCPPCGGA